MAKRKETKDVKVNEPKKVRAYIMKADVGTNKDGSIKRPKGSAQELSKEQIENYKSNNLI